MVDQSEALAVEPAAVAAPTDKVGPSGVGGWLLVLCILLTFVIPLLNVALVGLAALDAIGSAVRVPGLVALTVANGIMVVVLVGLSIFAGLSLWLRLETRSVKIARLYFLAFLASKLIAAGLPFVVGMDSRIAVQVAQATAGGVGGACAFAFAWITYLQKSKRVRATYGLPESVSA